MAFLLQVYSIPFSRTSIRSHALAFTICSRSFLSSSSSSSSSFSTIPTATTINNSNIFKVSSQISQTSPTSVSQSDSRILLGMSEQELQQLALDFGQVNFVRLNILWKPLNYFYFLMYLTFGNLWVFSKVIEGSRFIILFTRGK